MGIKPGTAAAEVARQLGEPLYRVWNYPSDGADGTGCCAVILDSTGERVIRSMMSGVNAPADGDLVLAQHGPPLDERWVYADCGAEVAENHSFRRREVRLRNGRVDATFHEVNID